MESKPHAVSESESFCCDLLVVTTVVEVGRRCWLDLDTLPCSKGVLGWLAAWSRDDPKSCALRLLLFLIGAYFGGGIIFWSNFGRRKGRLSWAKGARQPLDNQLTTEATRMELEKSTRPRRLLQSRLRINSASKAEIERPLRHSAIPSDSSPGECRIQWP